MGKYRFAHTYQWKSISKADFLKRKKNNKKTQQNLLKATGLTRSFPERSIEPGACSPATLLCLPSRWPKMTLWPEMSPYHQPRRVAATGKNHSPCPPELGRSLRMGCSASSCLYRRHAWTTLGTARRFHYQLSRRGVPGSIPFSCFFSRFAHVKR